MRAYPYLPRHLQTQLFRMAHGHLRWRPFHYCATLAEAFQTIKEPGMTELVLVTGGSGYIGGWCVKELLRRGFRVRTTLRDPSRAARVTDAVQAPTDRLEFATADLTADDGWADAAKDATYVLHVASPLVIAADGRPESVIDPARDGTLRVLRPAADAGVRRVVVTSAANAASPLSYTTDGVTDETLWTDPDALGLIPYRRAKTLAEKAAWDFAESSSTELATILPGAVFGPILSTDNIGSVAIIAGMLDGKIRRIPRIGLEVADVRDVVDIHLRAMESPAAAGQRFLATGEFLWMRELAEMLRANLGDKAKMVPTRSIPDFVVRLAARRDPALAEVIPALGRRNRHSTAKARDLLGWQPRPVADTVLDCARSLLDHGVA